MSNVSLPPGYQPPDAALAALAQIEEGYPFVYLAGKAGVGKSTFLEYLKLLKQDNANPILKGMAIVAPTGIAAINVGAQTIHSFLKIAPHDRPGGKWAQGNTSIAVKNLTLLVIDEISMVNAYLLDVMNEKLQYYKGNDKPFGGVPILAVGDIFQLSPVNTDRDKCGYQSDWFWYAKVIAENPPVCQELTKVYRQTDEKFLNLLNDLRLKRNLNEALHTLNSAALNSRSDQYPMSLTATNDAADQINQSKMAMIDSTPRIYVATIGVGIEQKELKNFQSPQELVLKVGTRVMATANIINSGVVNGHLGWVTKLLSTSVLVQFDFGGPEIEIKPYTWKKVAWEYTAKKNLEEVPKGSYTQIPLRVGYAVSIHKAQGLTLDSVLIDLGRGAFASGQTYVALSRCRTLEGIHLTRPVTAYDLILDGAVSWFYENYLEPNPNRIIPPPPAKKIQMKYVPMKNLLEPVVSKMETDDPSNFYLPDLPIALPPTPEEIEELQALVAKPPTPTIEVEEDVHIRFGRGTHTAQVFKNALTNLLKVTPPQAQQAVTIKKLLQEHFPDEHETPAWERKSKLNGTKGPSRKAAKPLSTTHFPMRSPCRCGSTWGVIETMGSQDCLYCEECQTYQYNVSKVERAALGNLTNLQI